VFAFRCEILLKLLFAQSLTRLSLRG